MDGGVECPDRSGMRFLTIDETNRDRCSGICPERTGITV